MTVASEPDEPVDDDAPVPKIPYSKGLHLSRPQIFRIGMFATLLVAIIVLAKPCSDSVSKFVTSFDDGSNAGSAMPKPGTVSVPQNLEHVGSNLTLEQYQDLVKRAEAAADAKWRCTSDADCMTSCSQGAVSRAWYATAKVDECKDGCESDGAAAPQCLEHQCVAFRVGKDGK